MLTQLNLSGIHKCFQWRQRSLRNKSAWFCCVVFTLFYILLWSELSFVGSVLGDLRVLCSVWALTLCTVYLLGTALNKLLKRSISWNFHPLPLELFVFEGFVLVLIGLHVRQILSIKLSFLMLTMMYSVVISSVLLFDKTFIWPKS